MAGAHRRDFTWDDLDELARNIRESADRLDAVCQAGRKSGMESVVSPGRSVENTYLPRLRDWTRRLQLELELQIDAFQREQRRAASGKKKPGRKPKAKARTKK